MYECILLSLVNYFAFSCLNNRPTISHVFFCSFVITLALNLLMKSADSSGEILTILLTGFANTAMTLVSFLFDDYIIHFVVLIFKKNKKKNNCNYYYILSIILYILPAIKCISHIQISYNAILLDNWKKTSTAITITIVKQRYICSTDR